MVCVLRTDDFSGLGLQGFPSSRGRATAVTRAVLPLPLNARKNGQQRVALSDGAGGSAKTAPG